jgi:hypothetical protein
VITVNKAVHPYLKEVILYRANPSQLHHLPDWAMGIASLNMDHHKRSGIEKKYILEERCESDHLMKIIGSFIRDKQIDLFQSDVEGFDLETLRMIDFDIFRPLIIKFEHVNLTKEDIREAIRLLRAKGYFYFYQYPDIIALQLDKISL